MKKILKTRKILTMHIARNCFIRFHFTFTSFLFFSMMMMMMMMMMMEIMMMYCFRRMVDHQKVSSLVFSRDHCQKLYTSQSSNAPSSKICTCEDAKIRLCRLTVITTTPRGNYFHKEFL